MLLQQVKKINLGRLLDGEAWVLSREAPSLLDNFRELFLSDLERLDLSKFPPCHASNSAEVHDYIDDIVKQPNQTLAHVT